MSNSYIHIVKHLYANCCLLRDAFFVYKLNKLYTTYKYNLHSFSYPWQAWTADSSKQCVQSNENFRFKTASDLDWDGA